MDEIFDRIKAAKINKKYLAWSLIFTEILGIITLVWYLKNPLYQKYFITSPKSYSLSQMDTASRYLVNQGDYINNQINPDEKIILVLRDAKQIYTAVRINPDSNGFWTFQIPNTLSTGVKIITTAKLTPEGNLKEIQNHRLRIRSNQILNRDNNEPAQTILEEGLSIIEDATKAAYSPSTREIFTSPNIVRTPLSQPIAD